MPLRLNLESGRNRSWVRGPNALACRQATMSNWGCAHDDASCARIWCATSGFWQSTSEFEFERRDAEMIAPTHTIGIVRQLRIFFLFVLFPSSVVAAGAEELFMYEGLGFNWVRWQSSTGFRRTGAESETRTGLRRTEVRECTPDLQFCDGGCAIIFLLPTLQETPS